MQHFKGAGKLFVERVEGFRFTRKNWSAARHKGSWMFHDRGTRCLVPSLSEVLDLMSARGATRLVVHAIPRAAKGL